MNTKEEALNQNKPVYGPLSPINNEKSVENIAKQAPIEEKPKEQAPVDTKVN